jgi:hypothetical protein
MRSKMSSKVIWIGEYILSYRQEFVYEMCFLENKRE